MPTFAELLDQLADRLENASALDAPSDAIAGVLRRVITPGPVEDALSGTPIAHPAHPALVAVPIGAWTAALVLDATGADGSATRRLVGVGVLSAVPTALTGASDWLTTTGAERRVGLVHALSNAAALGLQIASWRARGRGSRPRGVALSAASAVILGASGWLGGHLAYALGVGVDTTAFQQLPQDWTDAGAVSDLVGPHVADVGGVPILIFRSGERIVAMADRCTHRGGPLHEGTVADGCVTCPWHGSMFADDGTVRRGPASRPQPALDTRIVDGRVQVRRSEPRALRQNPAGR